MHECNEQVILNEPMFAEYILSAVRQCKTNGNNIYTIVNVVARYLYQRGGVTDNKELAKRLETVAQKLDKNKSTSSWKKLVKRLLNKENLTKPLSEIVYVPITKAEFDVIDSLNGVHLQKLAFTLLCLAKYRNLRNPENDDWENFSIKYIFSLANILVTKDRQYNMIHSLINLGLIRASSMVLNTNIHVNFVDNNSPEVLKISDFRNLGNVYLKHTGVRCDTCTICGALFVHKKQSKNLYCSSCRVRFRKISSNNLYITIEERPILSTCALCGEPVYINPKLNWLTQLCPNCEEENSNLVFTSPQSTE